MAFTPNPELNNPVNVQGTEINRADFPAEFSEVMARDYAAKGSDTNSLASAAERASTETFRTQQQVATNETGIQSVNQRVDGHQRSINLINQEIIRVREEFRNLSQNPHGGIIRTSDTVTTVGDGAVVDASFNATSPDSRGVTLASTITIDAGGDGAYQVNGRLFYTASSSFEARLVRRLAAGGSTTLFTFTSSAINEILPVFTFIFGAGDVLAVELTQTTGVDLDITETTGAYISVTRGGL